MDEAVLASNARPPVLYAPVSTDTAQIYGPNETPLIYQHPSRAWQEDQPHPVRRVGYRKYILTARRMITAGKRQRINGCLLGMKGFF